jgi:hypothetical protein
MPGWLETAEHPVLSAVLGTAQRRQRSRASASDLRLSSPKARQPTGHVVHEGHQAPGAAKFGQGQQPTALNAVVQDRPYTLQARVAVPHFYPS